MNEFEVVVDGLPPAKSGRSIFGVRSGHHERVRDLLAQVHRVKSARGFRGFGRVSLRMDVELRAGTTLRLSDATNYLGGIADVLESKKRREFASGALVHLGYQRNVAVYEDDSQIKEVHYRAVESDTTSYRVTLRALE